MEIWNNKLDLIPQRPVVADTVPQKIHSNFWRISPSNEHSIFVTTRKESCRKVMFSQEFVCPPAGMKSFPVWLPGLMFLLGGEGVCLQEGSLLPGGLGG